MYSQIASGIDVCACWKFSYLEFSQCETTSNSCSSVILDCRALNDRSKSVSWSRSDSCGLCETSGSASVLSCWLVEMYSYSSLPILVEMGVGDDVIVLDCLCGGLACCQDLWN